MNAVIRAGFMLTVAALAHAQLEPEESIPSPPPPERVELLPPAPLTDRENDRRLADARRTFELSRRQCLAGSDEFRQICLDQVRRAYDETMRRPDPDPSRRR
jgi:hypothetical protein